MSEFRTRRSLATSVHERKVPFARSFAHERRAAHERFAHPNDGGVSTVLLKWVVTASGACEKITPVSDS